MKGDLTLLQADKCSIKLQMRSKVGSLCTYPLDTAGGHVRHLDY